MFRNEEAVYLGARGYSWTGWMLWERVLKGCYEAVGLISRC
jgi:hypothetical protein